MSLTVDNVAGDWVSVSVAARMLRRTSNQIMSLHAGGKIRRKLRRVSHAHCRPVWMYYVPDLLALKEQYQKSGDWQEHDQIVWRSEDVVWLAVSDACHLLRCTATTVYALIESGDLRSKKRVQFDFPRARKATGVHVRDVMALRRRQEATNHGPAASEELGVVAIESDSSVDLATQLRTIIVEAKSANITKKRLLGILEALVDAS